MCVCVFIYVTYACVCFYFILLISCLGVEAVLGLGTWSPVWIPLPLRRPILRCAVCMQDVNMYMCGFANMRLVSYTKRS